MNKLFVITLAIIATTNIAFADSISNGNAVRTLPHEQQVTVTQTKTVSQTTVNTPVTKKQNVVKRNENSTIVSAKNKGGLWISDGEAKIYYEPAENSTLNYNTQVEGYKIVKARDYILTVPEYYSQAQIAKAFNKIRGFE